MKKKLTAFAVMIALLIPAAALAYTHPRYGRYLQYTMSQYGVLTERLAARTGPGTQYSELGTYLNKGDWVKIVSISYDRENRPWVQVEFEIKDIPVRAYTGLKRFSGVDEAALFRGDEGRDESTYVWTSCTPLYGPGRHFGRYSFSLREYTEVVIRDLENGYYQCEFQSPDGKRHIGWIECDWVM